MKKLGHIDADGVVQLKGRAASLIDTGDELLVTELMFNGECYSSSQLEQDFLDNLHLIGAIFLSCLKYRSARFGRNKQRNLLCRSTCLAILRLSG